MENTEYGPLRHLIGTWASEGFRGENRAPSPRRDVENTKFRQEISFDPVGDVSNHEQLLYVLRYSTKAWEEGDDGGPFHEEVGYFIWDGKNEQVMKSFIVPRGIAVQAGGTAKADDRSFSMKAELGSPTYGVCSNIFLDEEFQTVSYEVSFSLSDDKTLTYEENTRIKIKGQEGIFDHIEKNTLSKV